MAAPGGVLSHPVHQHAPERRVVAGGQSNGVLHFRVRPAHTPERGCTPFDCPLVCDEERNGVAFHHQAGETPAYEVVAATDFGFGFGKGDAHSHTRRRPGSGGPTSAHICREVGRLWLFWPPVAARLQSEPAERIGRLECPWFPGRARGDGVVPCQDTQPMLSINRRCVAWGGAWLATDQEVEPRRSRLAA